MQLDSLRSSARWLVAAFAAVAALLVGGLQISGIGALPDSSWRLYLAIGSVGIALAAVGYMIREASVVLTHEWLTLASLGDEPGTGRLPPTRQDTQRAALIQTIEEKLAVSRHELFGYAAASVEQLHARLADCDELIWRGKLGTEAVSAAQQEAALLRRAARDAVQYANYYFTLRLFQRMRARIGWAAGIVAVSVGVFGYTVSTPAHHAPTSATISRGR